MRIAILGCTGQIGRCLVSAYAARHELLLYARDMAGMQGWLDRNGLTAAVRDLSEFPDGQFDLVINAIGDGVPGKIRAQGEGIIEVNEHFDRQCLDHLARDPARKYIFLSTGRVYGPAYEAAQEINPMPLEDFPSGDAYPRAKCAAELRHRELADAAIADIRIFGFVSPEINLDDDFLVAEILRALKNDAEFVTGPEDVVRDYVVANDLVALIDRLVDAGVPNGAYDIFSARPTTKSEMLKTLGERLGLRFRVKGTLEPIEEGKRPALISQQTAAAGIGHRPKKSSIENVVEVAGSVVAHARSTEKQPAL